MRINRMLRFAPVALLALGCAAKTPPKPVAPNNNLQRYAGIYRQNQQCLQPELIPFSKSPNQGRLTETFEQRPYVYDYKATFSVLEENNPVFTIYPRFIACRRGSPGSVLIIPFEGWVAARSASALDIEAFDTNNKRVYSKQFNLGSEAGGKVKFDFRDISIMIPLPEGDAAIGRIEVLVVGEKVEGEISYSLHQSQFAVSRIITGVYQPIRRSVVSQPIQRTVVSEPVE